MPYLIVANRRGETDRRALVRPVVIGRSAECDLVVRDIELSRRHCVIEQIAGRWILHDLNSKNGTRIGSQTVGRHLLDDGDIVRIGKSRICFREGAFVSAPDQDAPRAPHVRAADPVEALASTVSGFRLTDAEEDDLDADVLATFPRPRPRPIEPRSFHGSQVQTMLAEIASSSWDALLTAPSRRVRITDPPRPMIDPHQTELSRDMVRAHVAPGLPAERTIPHPIGLQRFFALSSIALAISLTSVAMWVISWSW